MSVFFLDIDDYAVGKLDKYEQMFETNVRIGDQTVSANGARSREMTNYAGSPKHLVSKQLPVALRQPYLAAPQALRASGPARSHQVSLVSRPIRLVRWFSIGLLALAITLVGQALPWPSASATDEAVSVTMTYVTVKAGDSLWGLAERHAPQSDPREWVSKVAQLNNLSDSGLQAGQRLAIPGK